MLIKCKLDYQLLGTDIQVITGKTYEAEPAYNLPDYEAEGKVFVTNAENDTSGIGLCLTSDDYDIIEGDK